MNRPTSLRRYSIGRHKLAFTITSLLVASSIAPVATACDYCDQGDGGIVCDSGCDRCDSGCDGCSPIFPGKPAGPVFKALDKIAGGVEKLFGLDKCGAKGGANCDDACDAAMIEDLMIPMDSATTDPYYSQPVMPSVPAENYSQPLEGFSQPMTTPEPQYREPQLSGAPVYRAGRATACSAATDPARCSRILR